MAKRGRPRKNAKVEVENPAPVEETTQEEEVIEEAVVEEVKEEAPQPMSESVGEGTQGEFNPFAENVFERDYSTPKVAQGIVSDIEEPEFKPTSYDDIVRDNQSADEQEHGSAFDNPNPALNDMDFKDKKVACESLVDTTLDTYEQLHTFAQKFVAVSENQLAEMEMEGKISLNEQIPVDEEGNTMTLMDFVNQYNQQSAEALEYDKEFGYKVRPAMLRVFMKKGWGMTDEQYLMYMFGKDILTKAAIVFSLKKTMNNTFDIISKNYKQNKAQAEAAPDYEDYDDDEEEEITPQEEAPNIRVEDEIPLKVDDLEKTTKKMNIHMPQNPKDKMAQHPNEVRDEIKDGMEREEKSKKKKKKKDE